MNFVASNTILVKEKLVIFKYEYIPYFQDTHFSFFFACNLHCAFQSTGARRLKSDDISASQRLPLLKERFYQDILCEIGGMFAIANKIDKIHRRPWIGFQSWQADGRKVILFFFELR